MKKNQNNTVLLTTKDDINKTITWDKIALHSAVRNHDYKQVELLLRNGANPNISDNPAVIGTPLHFVAWELCRSHDDIDESIKTFTILLQYKANINALNKFNSTPINTLIEDYTTKLASRLPLLKLLFSKYSTKIDFTTKFGPYKCTIVEEAQQLSYSLNAGNTSGEDGGKEAKIIYDLTKKAAAAVPLLWARKGLKAKTLPVELRDQITEYVTYARPTLKKA